MKNKNTVGIFGERCLPLRASDVAFGSDVHCVSDVSPRGEVGKHHITLRPTEAKHHCALALHHCGVAATSLFTNAPKVCYTKTEKAEI